MCVCVCVFIVCACNYIYRHYRYVYCILQFVSILGHLAPVYCCMFDKTGQRVITVSTGTTCIIVKFVCIYSIPNTM